ncbi:MAG: hypothetical protein PHH49_05065 [Candidatus Omnitrophica bacterium]|nr:hypothetical protein [Candidatus Omnitrophota bacterium]MDD5488315.1 hypothetical protein [Candidatus Omnitrophota bacterium]
MEKKAIALISGGLDSLLAARVVMDQGVEVQGVCFILQFASRDTDSFIRKVLCASEEAGIQVKFVDISEKFFNVLKDPGHGYGSNMNPCIDCKILMLKVAKDMMKELGASFVVTGEVLGERPMSQHRRALDRIEKCSGLEGLLLRPLSAGFMEQTLPEEKGVLDRKKLWKIHGRGREKQLKLAKEYGLTRYFSPGGGCLLTDPMFSRKLRELAKKGPLDKDNALLLKYGRHFRLDDGTKVVVGRNKDDNESLKGMKKKSDVVLWFGAKTPGPYAILRGKATEGNIEKAAGLVVSHSRYRKERTANVELLSGVGSPRQISTVALSREEIEDLRV